MFGSLDPAKLLMILVIALVVLGPERLPKAARQLGGAWRELAKLRDQVTEEIRSAIPDVDLPRIPRNPAGAVSGFLRDLTSTPSANVEAEAGLSHESSDASKVSSDSMAHTSPSLPGPTASDEVRATVSSGARPTPARQSREASARQSGSPVTPDDPGMN